MNVLKSYAQTRPNRSKAILVVVAALLLFAFIGLIVTLLQQKEPAPPDQPKTLQPQVTAHISITKDGFSPAVLAIEKGTVVTWTNDDEAPHQLQANPHPTGKSLPGLKSEILNSKQTYRYTANKVGSFGYHDHLNPTINGNLDVKE